MQITINGEIKQVVGHETILQVCEQMGLFIPTLCYDKRLVPHGACRMCVVEVEKARSLVASCSTPVSDGMVIYTHSDRVEKARKDILKLIWSTHRNDCLTCSQNGNCRLQDLCYLYDIDPENNHFKKRLSHHIDDSNPFYTIDRDKCILCGKCVRVCSELQGTTAIGFSQRGYKTHITHPFEMGMTHSDCVSCGNCVSVCPTGAISEKKRAKSRSWEEKQVETTCGYCGVGCQINLHIKDNRVVGVSPANSGVNNELLCVKGKFAYHFISHQDRLKYPMIRKSGELVRVSWEEALSLIASKITDIKNIYGSDAIGGFTSARCTTEDNYVMQKFFRAVVGTNSVDHCARL